MVDKGHTLTRLTDFPVSRFAGTFITPLRILTVLCKRVADVCRCFVTLINVWNTKREVTLLCLLNKYFLITVTSEQFVCKGRFLELHFLGYLYTKIIFHIKHMEGGILVIVVSFMKSLLHRNNLLKEFTQFSLITAPLISPCFRFLHWSLWEEPVLFLK